MRNGGPGLSHSSQSLQVAAHSTAASVAEYCGSETGEAAPVTSSATGSMRIMLPNIACSIGVEHRAGHARRCVERAERGHRRDLLWRSDAAERDVGEQGLAA